MKFSFFKALHSFIVSGQCGGVIDGTCLEQCSDVCVEEAELLQVAGVFEEGLGLLVGEHGSVRVSGF